MPNTACHSACTASLMLWRPADKRTRASGITALCAKQAREVDQCKADAERLVFAYGRTRTESNALVELEIRMLNDDYPTMEEVRSAIDLARTPPPAPTEGK